MSALDDLRNVETALDSAITGWIGYSWKATTKLGEKCFAMVAQMRARHYKAWGENCALRARLSRALDNENGVRDANAAMTAQIEELESAARHYAPLLRSRDRAQDTCFHGRSPHACQECKT